MVSKELGTWGFKTCDGCFPTFDSQTNCWKSLLHILQAAPDEETADTFSSFLAEVAHSFHRFSTLTRNYHWGILRELLPWYGRQKVDKDSWLWIRFEVLGMLLFQIDKHEPKNCAILIHIVPQLRTFPVCFQSLHRFMQAKDLSVEESEPEEASMVGEGESCILSALAFAVDRVPALGQLRTSLCSDWVHRSITVKIEPWFYDDFAVVWSVLPWHMDTYGWLWMNVAIKPTAINLKPSQIPNHLGRWTPFQIDPNSGIPCYSQK